MLLEWQVFNEQRTQIAQGTSSFVDGPLHIRTDLPECTLGRIAAFTKIDVHHHDQIFMNGYQTWTTCPEYGYHDSIRGLNRIPDFLKKKYAFDRYGDYHFVDYPEKKGILHGFSWMTLRRGGYYRLIASLDERPGYTMFTLNTEQNELSIIRDCEGRKTEGEYPLFDLFYAEGSEQEVYDAWFREMQIRARTTEKLYGYSSWYNRYQNINEDAILQDLNGCRSIFTKNDLFQIDDGWELKVGDWLEEDHAKFPSGMKKMADSIHEAGFRAGLWLAPFVAEKNSQLCQQHPDWLLKVDGEPWQDGCNWSGFYSLDLDHPEVLAYLEKVFDRVLNEWGYDLVKLDFLYGAAPFGNEKETRAGRMYRALELLRKWCGDKLILGCGVPVMPAFGLVDYCRISCDVSLDWDDVPYMRIFHRERTSTKNAIANILSRKALNGRAYLSDPDVFFLREKNLKLSEQRKLSLAKLDALLGGVFLTSDDPSSYTEEMKRRYLELRNLTHASDLHLRRIGDRVEVSYFLDGMQRRELLF